MNANKQIAIKLAKQIEWNTEAAYEIARILLIACNMHREANALEMEYEAVLADDEEDFCKRQVAAKQQAA